MTTTFSHGAADMDADDDDRPATKKDLRVLGAELRAEMQQMRADLLDKLDSRTTALLFSQVAALFAVAAIAFAN